LPAEPLTTRTQLSGYQARQHVDDQYLVGKRQREHAKLWNEVAGEGTIVPNTLDHFQKIVVLTNGIKAGDFRDKDFKSGK
jgi:hypothetical protein